MTLLAVIGWVGGLTTASMLVPQLVALLRTGNTKGMAWQLWVVFLGTSLGWISHGIKLGQAFIVVANVVSLAVTLVSLYYLHRDRKLPSPWLALFGVAWAGALAVLDWRISSAVFGLSVVTPIAIAKLHQAFKVFRDPVVTGVSRTSWVAQLVNELIWLTWGLMAPDAGVIISAAVTGTCNATVLTGLVYRHARRR